MCMCVWVSFYVYLDRLPPRYKGAHYTVVIVKNAITMKHLTPFVATAVERGVRRCRTNLISRKRDWVEI